MFNTTIALYASPIHLNSMLVLSKFIAKYNPSVAIIILSTAPDSAADSIASVPAVTYHHMPTAAIPPNFTKDPVEQVFEIPRLNNPILLDILKEISGKSRINAFVMDFFCYAAHEVSTELGIPTYYYVSSGGFFLCVLLYLPEIHENVAGDIGELNNFVEVPGCPLVYSSDFPTGMHFRQSNSYIHFVGAGVNMRKSDGILVNAFDALEVRARDTLANGACVPDTPSPPVYLVGPLIDEIGGKNGVTEQHECVKWLDSQPRKSVIFLCFGRWGLFSREQLKEMAVGLENSGQRFLWLVRNPPAANVEPDLGELLPDGFLERTKDRGFVVKSWVPQKEVLSHTAVAGFVTHCGRSSILEAVSFGVPMIGWPLYAEQKMNRTFMVEEMKISLPLVAAEDGLVKAAELEKRVRELVESDTARDIRRRIAELRVSAALAVEENGSSVVALKKFVNRVGVQS